MVRQTSLLYYVACAIPKKVFEEVGGFDEDFFPALYEDVDLGLRIRLRGYKILRAPP